MRAHDAYEALAGAVALGEATPWEQAVVAEHARVCPLCAGDAGLATGQLSTLVQSMRELETWKPELCDVVLKRVTTRRSQHVRNTMIGLGCAIVASFGLNLAFATGAAQQLAVALQPQPSPLPVIAYVVVRAPRWGPR